MTNGRKKFSDTDEYEVVEATFRAPTSSLEIEQGEARNHRVDFVDCETCGQRFTKAEDIQRIFERELVINANTVEVCHLCRHRCTECGKTVVASAGVCCPSCWDRAVAKPQRFVQQDRVSLQKHGALFHAANPSS